MKRIYSLTNKIRKPDFDHIEVVVVIGDYRILGNVNQESSFFFLPDSRLITRVRK